MASLRDSDLRRALAFLNERCEPAEPERYLRQVLEGLYDLIPADHWAFGECGAPNRPGAVRVQVHPLDYTGPPIDLINNLGGALALPHPLGFAEAHAARVSRISDVLTRREWHELPCYREFYRYMEVEDDLCAYFRVGDMAAFFGMIRSSIVPTRDLELANAVIRPVLAGLKNALALARLEQKSSLLAGAVASKGRPVLVTKLDGTIITETAAARRILLAYFDKEAFVDRIPQALLDFASKQRTRLLNLENKDLLSPAFRLYRDQRLLTIEVVVQSNGFILTLREESSVPRLDYLHHLGLSNREAEVLSYVAMGKTNAEIALILGISRLTVGKHMEHILARLGVETRTAAAAVAIEARKLNGA